MKCNVEKLTIQQIVGEMGSLDELDVVFEDGNTALGKAGHFEALKNLIPVEYQVIPFVPTSQNSENPTILFRNKSGATVAQLFQNLTARFKLDTLFENDLKYSGFKADYLTMMSKVPLMFRAYIPEEDGEVQAVIKKRIEESIGDVNSTARGSGARFNQGKPDMSLIPLTILADSAPRGCASELIEAIKCVGRFQMRASKPSDIDELNKAVRHLADHLPACANVFDYGRKKYAAWNWAKGMAWSIPIACIGRHFYQVVHMDEATDSESGFSHIGHILCNIIMLIWYIEHYHEGDDRYEPAPIEG